MNTKSRKNRLFNQLVSVCKTLLKLIYQLFSKIRKINRPILNKDPSDIFKQLFALDNIEKTYKEYISIKDFRGIDRIGLYQFDRNKDTQFKIIQQKVLGGSYKFSPFIERLQLRDRNRRPRVISIPTMRDRIVLSLLKDYLHKIFPECVNRKLPNTYIREIKDFYDSNKNPEIYFYKADIASFYDNINHQKLIKTIENKIISKPEFLLIKRSIETPSVALSQSTTISKKTKNKCGVPQGLAISNILANIYLHESDKKFMSYCIKYFRYVDDMLFILQKGQKRAIKSLVKNDLHKMKLDINENKTGFASAIDGIEYLGYYLRLPTVSVKQKTIDRYLRSLSALFSSYLRKSNQTHEPAQQDMIRDIFISDINERITGAISKNHKYGWIFYFLEMNDLSLIYTIDKIIKDRFCSRIKVESTRSVIMKSIKRLSKAYYNAKYSPLSGYIHNYDIYDTIPKKIKFLVSIGIIRKDEEDRYLPEEIEYNFNSTMKKRLSALEADVGETS